jgi:hypothetical protein
MAAAVRFGAISFPKKHFFGNLSLETVQVVYSRLLSHRALMQPPRKIRELSAQAEESSVDFFAVAAGEAGGAFRLADGGARRRARAGA